MLKPGTPRMTAQGMVFLVIIYDLESVAEAQYDENDSSGHGFFLVIIYDLESVAEARHDENDGSEHGFLVNYS